MIGKIEAIVMGEKVMSMSELIIVMRREGMEMDRDAIIAAIAADELARIGAEPLGKKEVSALIKNFSPPTAQRQLLHLRSGLQVSGPWPNTLERNVKVHYPPLEVAAVMYIQNHTVSMRGRPSLRRILETRHD